MNNLYLIFTTEQERRDFMLELMGFKVYLPEKKKSVWNPSMLTKIGKPKDTELDSWFNPLEFGKMSSPYLDLNRIFGKNGVSENLKNAKPWHPASFFQKGLGRMYTLRSYRHRYGYWLVLQYMNTPVSHKNHDWVLKRIPKEQVGYNAKPSCFAPHKEFLSWTSETLNLPLREKLSEGKCHEIFSLLSQVKEKSPESFSGDNIYLWENLAHRFFLLDDIEHCEICCRNQAELQPHSSDAFLNLGYYLSQVGRKEEAVEVYKQGLKVAPDDEFLSANMASLLRDS